MNHQLTNDQIRAIRAGYKKKTSFYITDDQLDQLSQAEVLRYHEAGRAALQSEEWMGIAKGVAMWTAIGGIVMALFWGSLFPTKKSGPASYGNSTPSSSSYSGSSYSQSLYSNNDDDDDCNPNYSGCVENSSFDLDCADVDQEVEVIGYDEYGLDRDNDGWGCEGY